MGVPIDLVNEYVAHRVVSGVHGDPTPCADRIGRQFGLRQWFILSDRRHPDRTEPFTCRLFNLPERCTVTGTGRTDLGHGHILARSDRYANGS